MAETTTLKAIAVKNGMKDSQVASATYTIEYVVTVNVEGNGTASASPAHGATGTEVDLTAKPRHRLGAQRVEG